MAELETPELDQEVAEGESQAREAAAAAVQARAERSEAEAALNAALAAAPAWRQADETLLVLSRAQRKLNKRLIERRMP